jgi:hypothetical protein
MPEEQELHDGFCLVPGISRICGVLMLPALNLILMLMLRPVVLDSSLLGLQG